MKAFSTLVAISLCLLTSIAAHSQNSYVPKAPAKIGSRMNQLMRQQQQPMRLPSRMKSTSTQQVVHAMIQCTDGERLHTTLRSMGIESTAISSTLVTAHVPMNRVWEVTRLEEVVKIDAPRRFKRFNHTSRVASGVDKAQSGTGLDTPYDGTGVVIGVIDQGFQYTHPAFRKADGSSRIVYLWNHLKGDKTPTTASDDILQAVNDGEDTNHATHVAGIAGGSRWTGVQDYGMAPKATLMFFPSTFDDSEILEDVKRVKEYATQKNMPWVVNMSFGSQSGPHDGSTAYDHTLSGYVSNGGFIAAAIGNEAERKIHLSHEFASDKDTLYALIDEGQLAETTYADIWIKGGTDKDVKVDVFAYNSRKKMFDYRNEAFWYGDKNTTDTLVHAWGDAVESNGKYNLTLGFNFDKILEYEENGDEIFNSRDMHIGIRVVAPKGARLDSWLDAQTSEWKNIKDARFATGDNLYCVGEGAASSEKVVAVGSYNTTDSWKTYKNKTITNKDSGALNDISSFSCYGPQVDNSFPKPAVVAPGSMISSAYGNVHDSFDEYDDGKYLTQKLTYGGEEYFYGMEEGTSMASPAVTGIIALWLQAYPQLSYEQLMEVFRTTSKKDQFTTSNEWDRHAGYGKIDAYEGLKAVLKLRDTGTGLFNIKDTSTPLTFRTQGRVWQLLFNSSETYADIALHTTAGVQVYEKQVSNVSAGHEETIDLQRLPAGVYVLSVKTVNSAYSRKVVVR